DTRRETVPDTATILIEACAGVPPVGSHFKNLDRGAYPRVGGRSFHNRALELDEGCPCSAAVQTSWVSNALTSRHRVLQNFMPVCAPTISAVHSHFHRHK